MKVFDVHKLSLELQGIVWDLPNLEIDDSGGATFKVVTAPDPEWGNMHIPLALYLIEQGANKGEIVYLKNITHAKDWNVGDEFNDLNKNE